MHTEKFLQEIAKIIEVDVRNLTPDFTLKNCLTWDSLSVVSVIGMLDSYFNITVEIEDIECCETIKDLLNLIPLEVIKNVS